VLWGGDEASILLKKTCIIVWLYMQVVSEDGNRVKREQPFTESDLEELQVIMSP
jgi:hypothetical protein